MYWRQWFVRWMGILKLVTPLVNFDKNRLIPAQGFSFPFPHIHQPYNTWHVNKLHTSSYRYLSPCNVVHWSCAKMESRTFDSFHSNPEPIRPNAKRVGISTHTKTLFTYNAYNNVLARNILTCPSNFLENIGSLNHFSIFSLYKNILFNY